MTKLLVFGGDSLVGSHFLETTRQSIAAAGRKRPLGAAIASFHEIDLEDAQQVHDLVAHSDAEVVVNFAGATKVDAVEKERPAGSPVPRGPSYQINAAAPAAMAKATHASRKYLISISTSFVFDGLHGPYNESTEPSAYSPQISWYGWTKGEGERLIRSADPAAAVLRIAYPYGYRYAEKLDFARRIADAHRRGASPAYFADQQITPTWIPDVSRVVEHLAGARLGGVFHAASPDVTSPLEFAREVVRAMGEDPSSLRPGSMTEFLQKAGATPRPRRGGLLCPRIQTAGLKLMTWKDGIGEYLRDGGLA